MSRTIFSANTKLCPQIRNVIWIYLSLVGASFSNYNTASHMLIGKYQQQEHLTTRIEGQECNLCRLLLCAYFDSTSRYYRRSVGFWNGQHSASWWAAFWTCARLKFISQPCWLTFVYVFPYNDNTTIEYKEMDVLHFDANRYL